MDPELAYQLTKLLFDQKKALAEVHPSAGRLELETAPKVAPPELHPGPSATTTSRPRREPGRAGRAGRRGRAAAGGREVASVPLPDGAASPSATATRSTGPR